MILIPFFVKQSKNEAKEVKLKSCFLDFQVKQRQIVKGGEGILIGADQIAFVTVENDQYKTIGKTYSYRDILEVQAFKNGVMVNSESRQDGEGIALLQAIKEVRPEFFIERISEHKGEKKSSIDIRVIVDDSKYPAHTVNFLQLAINEKDIFFRSSMNRATGFYNAIVKMIQKFSPKTEEEK
jgi:hypothetical protein